MKTSTILAHGAVLFALSSAALACGSSSTEKVGASASALTSAKPASEKSQAFKIDESSKATWEMDAPIEKIFGSIEKGMTGDLFIDPSDLTKTTGLIDVDVTKLELYQQKRKDDKDDKSEFGERVKNDTQNTHAREWLEVTEATPEEKRTINKKSQFSIKKVETSTPDVSKMTGAERKVTGKITGEVLLHGHKNEQTVGFEATFSYDGDKLKKVTVKTTEPLDIKLAEFAVLPPNGLESALDKLTPKVAKSAPVMIELVAVAK